MNLYGPRQLADGIRTVRPNVVLIAEDIHEDDYLFRPTVGSRSVAEILIHMAFFSNFDYLFHGEEHVTTLQAFDFGQFLREGASQCSASSRTSPEPEGTQTPLNKNRHSH